MCRPVQREMADPELTLADTRKEHAGFVNAVVRDIQTGLPNALADSPGWKDVDPWLQATLILSAQRPVKPIPAENIEEALRQYSFAVGHSIDVEVRKRLDACKAGDCEDLCPCVPMAAEMVDWAAMVANAVGNSLRQLAERLQDRYAVSRKLGDAEAWHWGIRHREAERIVRDAYFAGLTSGTRTRDLLRNAGGGDAAGGDRSK